MDPSLKKLHPDMELIGKFHPLLVHLPIGILIIGLLLYFWMQVDSSRKFGEALRPIFLFGAISAVLSCVTGLQLMESGEYDEQIVTRHRNTGIAVALLSFFFWYRLSRIQYKKILPYLAVSLMVLLIITGHFGGTLTHGSGFISFQKKGITTQKPVIANMEEATIYSDLIHPILAEKCISCHGAEKQKGNLRLDDSLQILKGGKNGKAISGIADESMIIRRLLLPPDDDEHMPPKEKGQLTKDEIALIRWWIKEGYSFSAKVRQVRKDSSIAVVLKNLQQPTKEPTEFVEDKWPEVTAADPEVINRLRKAGISITTISGTSNLLSINLLNLRDSSVQIWNELNKIREQIVSLKADVSFIQDEHLYDIGSFKNLRKISLAGTQVTDNVIEQLASLKNLSSLNVSGSLITYKGLMSLTKLEKLRFLYGIDLKESADANALVDKLPMVEVITTSFSVPILVSDTTEVKMVK